MRLLPGALRARLGESLALFLLAVLAIAAAVGSPAYGQAADGKAIEAELEAAEPAERSLALQTPVAEGLADRMVENLRAKALEVLHPTTLTEVSGAWAAGVAGTTLVARSEVCAHLAFDGTCPAAAGEVLAPDGPVGRSIHDGQLTLTVVGVYRPGAEATDPYWAGRSELTPLPRRAHNPFFTPISTFADPALVSVHATYDLIAGPGSLTPQTLSSLSARLESGPNFGFQVEARQGLLVLVRRIATTRAHLAASLPLGAWEALLLSGFVLLLTIAYGSVRRRSETALAALRGAPTRNRMALVLGPPVAILLLAAPPGLAVGWLAARVAGGPVALTPLSLAAGAGTLAAALIAGTFAAWRAQRAPLLDALRQVPPRSARGVVIAEVTVAAIGLATVVQAWVQPGSGLAVLAPIASAVVAGLAVARLVRYAAGVSGKALLQRAHLGPGLAALQLARRPGADRLVALMVVTVALAVHAVSAWDGTVVGTRRAAAAELGGARVLSVTAVSRSALLDAVRRADPQGRWAMAVARHRNGSADVVGVDSARLEAVTGLSGSLTGAVERLRPRSFDPIVRTASALALDFDVRTTLAAPMPLTVALTGPHGEPVTGGVEIPAGSGPMSVSVALPACATAPGCRLAWLSFGRTPNGIWVRRVGDLAGPALSLAARWRKGFDAGPETEVVTGDNEIAVVFFSSDPKVRSDDIRICVADAPLPLPVLVAADPSTVHTGELTSRQLFSGVDRAIEVVGAAPELPGTGDGGVLVDLELADRLSDSQDNTANLEVWLNRLAPSDVDDRLRAAGLVILGSETVAQRAASLGARGGEVSGANLRLAGAALGLLLTVLAMAIIAAGDRRRRVEELAALRLQGINRRAAVRAIGGYGLMTAVAFPAGLLVAFLTANLGTFPPPAAPRAPVVLGSLAVMAVVFAITAWTARRRLSADLPTDRETP